MSADSRVTHDPRASLLGLVRGRPAQPERTETHHPIGSQAGVTNAVGVLQQAILPLGALVGGEWSTGGGHSSRKPEYQQRLYRYRQISTSPSACAPLPLLHGYHY